MYSHFSRFSRSSGNPALKMHLFILSYLPPANEVTGRLVFTSVCLSTGLGVGISGPMFLLGVGCVGISGTRSLPGHGYVQEGSVCPGGGYVREVGMSSG